MTNLNRIAVIFDMDGVLLDSMHAHFLAFECFAKKHRIEFSETHFSSFFGLHNREIFPLWFNKKLNASEIEKYTEEKEGMYRTLAPSQVAPIPNAVDLVKNLYNSQIDLAVGSSGPRENVYLALEILGIRKYFKSVSTGDDTEHGKPDPAIFLHAASSLNISPSACIVVEDSVAGVEAALRAEMRVIALTSSFPANKLSKAHRIVNSLSEITSKGIIELLRS